MLFGLTQMTSEESDAVKKLSNSEENSTVNVLLKVKVSQ